MSRNWLLRVACFALVLAAGRGAHAQGTVVGEPNDEASTVFDQSQVRTFALTIAPADLAKINRKPIAEEWVKGTLIYKGKTYRNVGVRYK